MINAIWPIFFLIAALNILPLESFSQAPTDTIRADYSFWSNSYYLGEKELTKAELISLLNSNSLSNEFMQKWRSKKEWGFLTFTIGMIITTSSVIGAIITADNGGGSALEAKSTSYILTAAIGLTLDIIGISMIIGKDKSFNKAIKEYNKNPMAATEEFKLYLGLNRIGISIPIY